MTGRFDEPDHATPLTPEERRELIPAYIAYRGELNPAERENTARAQDWALARKRGSLSEKFIREPHRRQTYIAPLKAADNHDIGPLLASRAHRVRPGRKHLLLLIASTLKSAPQK